MYKVRKAAGPVPETRNADDATFKMIMKCVWLVTLAVKFVSGHWKWVELCLRKNKTVYIIYVSWSAKRGVTKTGPDIIELADRREQLLMFWFKSRATCWFPTPVKAKHPLSWKKIMIIKTDTRRVLVYWLGNLNLRITACTRFPAWELWRVVRWRKLGTTHSQYLTYLNCKHGGWLRRMASESFFLLFPFYRRLIDAVHGLEQSFLSYSYRQWVILSVSI